MSAMWKDALGAPDV